MPDIHWGYGFCIGGVCATDPDEGGVISPGGVGYDINCGVRLVRSNLFYQDVKPHLRTLVEELFRQVPTGVGKSGRYHFNDKELKHLLAEGTRYVVGRGLGAARDIEFTEADSMGPTRIWSAIGPWLAGPSSAAPWAREITSSKCR
jgi:tRNA-splicing ligase RtcB